MFALSSLSSGGLSLQREQAVSDFHAYSLPISTKGGFLLPVYPWAPQCSQKDGLFILVGVPGPVTVDRGLSHGILEEGLSRESEWGSATREGKAGWCTCLWNTQNKEMPGWVELASAVYGNKIVDF